MSETTSDKYHLAVYNRGKLKAPMSADVNKEFIASLAPVMHIAETSHGFVWRFRSGVHGPNDPIYQEIDRPSLSLSLSICIYTYKTSPKACKEVRRGGWN